MIGISLGRIAGSFVLLSACALCGAPAAVPVAGFSPLSPERGFVSLFDGKSLDGWVLAGGKGPGYRAEKGLLVCPPEARGTLFTKEEFGDFILRFAFRIEAGGNNGVAVRAPLEGNPAYKGMEIQILDDYASRYSGLKVWQYHGSVYGVIPAHVGALKPAGFWNSEEIMFRGSHVRVTVNTQVTVDADLESVRDPGILSAHPGVKRRSGHIGFMSHGSRVEFRHIRIQRLEPNIPPAGFTALFNGRNLTGWKGLVANPPARARMEPEELAGRQAAADEDMRKHWRVDDGTIVFDGKGRSLCTARDYADFELLVDWKIPPGGDSGIYLRGSPQVQIWDRDIGSGGLFNNKKNPSRPLRKADFPPGTWNRFRIIMRGDRVTVYLNGLLVVDGVTMENYWERDKPIYPKGQIELQSHGGPLYFRNIFIREL